MNQRDTRTTPGADLQALMSDFATFAPKLIFDLGPRLMLMSAKTTMDFFEAARTVIAATIPTPDISRRSRHDCCQIPETECPPRCVCDIGWKGCPNSTVQAMIRVTNTGSSTRNFDFEVTPFSGPGNPKGTVEISPATALLAPHDSVNVAAAFTIPPDFQHAGRYAAEFRIHGAYEQCVRMTLQVEPSTAKCCEPEHCEVHAGDLPIRIRAHRWYHHFQCSEPCFEVMHASECRDSEPNRHNSR